MHLIQIKYSAKYKNKHKTIFLFYCYLQEIKAGITVTSLRIIERKKLKH